MTDRTIDWDKPKHSVDQVEETRPEGDRNHEVDSPGERADDEAGDGRNDAGKVTRRQE